MRSRRDIFTGIELGSDKVRVLVATFKEPASESGEVVVRGYSEVPSLKVLKDEPVSPNIVSDQLLKAMQNAWNAAGIDGYPGFPVLVLSGAYVIAAPGVRRKPSAGRCRTPGRQAHRQARFRFPAASRRRRRSQPASASGSIRDAGDSSGVHRT